MKFVLGRVENIVGKGENAGYQHFLLFLQCFLEASFPGSLKLGLCGRWVNTHLLVLNDPLEEGYGKHCGKRKNMQVTSNNLLSTTLFSTFLKKWFNFWVIVSWAMLSIWTSLKFCYLVNSFPNNKFQTLSYKRVCGQQFQIWCKCQEVPQTGRKHWEKEKCSFQKNSPFPAVFSRDLFCRHVKHSACLGKV